MWPRRGVGLRCTAGELGWASRSTTVLKHWKQNTSSVSLSCDDQPIFTFSMSFIALSITWYCCRQGITWSVSFTSNVAQINCQQNLNDHFQVLTLTSRCFWAWCISLCSELSNFLWYNITVTCAGILQYHMYLHCVNSCSNCFTCFCAWRSSCLSGLLTWQH